MFTREDRRWLLQVRGTAYRENTNWSGTAYTGAAYMHFNEGD